MYFNCQFNGLYWYDTLSLLSKHTHNYEKRKETKKIYIYKYKKQYASLLAIHVLNM